MSRALIVGASRGLGASLVKQYASRSPNAIVHGTTRSSDAPDGFSTQIKWLTKIDLTKPDVGDEIVTQLGPAQPLDAVVITAGYFGLEDFSDKGPDWEAEQRMYTTSSIAPVFVVQRLVKAGLVRQGSKIILVSSESGSVTLRHEEEGGGNYAHHASKAALNMVGKLLSLDLKEKGIIVSLVHPGFMRTEMTKGVGFDKFYDEAGAITPDEAAEILIDWTDKLDLSKSGELWAPRGGCDIGTAEVVLGKDLPTPLRLPW